MSKLTKNCSKLALITGLLFNTSFTHALADVEKAQGPITKIAVTNENNQEPGFSICVNDAKHGEVCMWRRFNTFNYQQLLDVANMAVIANKQVMIQANFVGSLDAITVYN